MQICYGTILTLYPSYILEISKKYHTPFNFSLTLIQIGVPTHHNPVYLAAWVLGDADGINSAQTHPGISKNSILHQKVFLLIVLNLMKC